MKFCRRLVFLLSLCMLFGCAQEQSLEPIDYSYLKLCPLQGAYESPSDLPDLEVMCDNIVSGTFADDAVTDLQYLPDGSVAYGCTITAFKISSVYSGDLNAGEEIKVVEPYYIDDSDSIYYLGNYYPSDSKREYILFLDTQPSEFRFSGMYSPCAREYGRYPVVNPRSRAASYSNSMLNLGNANAEFYHSIYDEVIDKYMS